jgi:hypothetical protein
MDRLLVDALILLISAVFAVVSVVWGWQGITTKEIVLRGRHHYKGIAALIVSSMLMCMGTSVGCIIVYQVARFVQGATPFLLPR